MVPSELREALETRLEAASAEFREVKASARSAALILLLLAIGHIFVGALLYWVGTASDLAGGTEERDTARAILGANLVIGVMFLGCYKWARHRPMAALAASVAVLIGTRVLTTVLAPLSLTAGLWVSLAVLVVLARGLWSARRAGRLAKQFAAAQNVS